MYISRSGQIYLLLLSLSHFSFLHEWNLYDASCLSYSERSQSWVPIRIFYWISLCKIPSFVVRSYPSLVSSIRSKDTIQIPNQNQNENMKKFSSATFSQQISNKNIHTYIHNWSLQPISQDYWPCLIFIHKWQDLQFKVDSEWQVFLRNYSWQF